MDEFEVDKFIGNGLAGATAGDEFKQKVLRESTGTLIKGSSLKKRLRASGLLMGMCLIASGSFVCGRFSTSRQRTPLELPTRNLTATNSKELKQTVEVESGRFWRRKVMASLQRKPYQDYTSNTKIIELLKNYRQTLKEKYHEE